MAYSSIVKPTDYFNALLYTGNGSTNALTGVGFQPDWVWLKGRSNGDGSRLYDAVRGTTKEIYSDAADAESTNSNGLTAFGTDGFTLGSSSGTNGSSKTYVAWNWLGANGTASNSNGSITSTVSANTTAGFSIVSFTGTGSNATIGHGLGAVPKFYVVKDRSAGNDWFVYHGANTSAPETEYLKLNSTAATADLNTLWNDTAPTSSVFSLGTNGNVNTSSNTYIAYCFAEKKGYSKIGSYTGNGNANGAFIHTGFKPAFVILKNTGVAQSWHIIDNKRLGLNPKNYILQANASSAESSLEWIDIVSNGFKHRNNDAADNASGNNYIYMAFAENPFVANDSGTAVPVVAR
tara:strand:+ start:1386 stop:2432 length:1047 start_codon:yes stop_codon:yes gene_type:complete